VLTFEGREEAQRLASVVQDRKIEGASTTVGFSNLTVCPLLSLHPFMVQFDRC
jgi:hypothetical protein